MSELNFHKMGFENDPWEYLKKYTRARIALGRSGSSLPTKETLEFKLAHAHAKDALYCDLKSSEIMAQLDAVEIPSLSVASLAATRTEYLKRPDLGRSLGVPLELSNHSFDILIVLADGLSPLAVNEQGFELIRALHQKFNAQGFSMAPIILASNARVALGDAINELVKAKLVLVLIGERPGLSAYNSVGAYITYHARAGYTDEKRNCISNIHANGLNTLQAVEKIHYLCTESLRLKLSGIALKDQQFLPDVTDSKTIQP